MRKASRATVRIGWILLELLSSYPTTTQFQLKLGLFTRLRAKKIANSLRSVIVGGFLAARMQVLQRAPTSLRHWEPEKKSWH